MPSVHIVQRQTAGVSYGRRFHVPQAVFGGRAVVCAGGGHCAVRCPLFRPAGSAALLHGACAAAAAAARFCCKSLVFSNKTVYNKDGDGHFGLFFALVAAGFVRRLLSSVYGRKQHACRAVRLAEVVVCARRHERLAHGVCRAFGACRQRERGGRHRHVLRGLSLWVGERTGFFGVYPHLFALHFRHCGRRARGRGGACRAVCRHADAERAVGLLRNVFYLRGRRGLRAVCAVARGGSAADQEKET